MVTMNPFDLKCRLKNIQALCSSTDPNLPHAALFIPGIDGRNNPGSTMMMKYIFQGSVGKDLFEGSLDGEFELLEEAVVVVQELSVSIFWSNKAKAAFGHLLSEIPFVVEYVPPVDADEDVDAFQNHKCVDFKRMMLECVPEGGVIGIPVPLGYDDVLDAESWPLLQAFALESVLTSTGFFTAHYAVIDITEPINTMYRTLDNMYVSKALSVVKDNILPHMQQMFTYLHSDNATKRSEVTAEDIVSPLDMLFEFGELETVFPVDPQLRPVVYLSQASGAVGRPASSWANVKVDHNSSFILEASEPSTGIRWCRTFFLQRGRPLPIISDPDALVSDTPRSALNSPRTDASFTRMEALYVKLYLALRYSVKYAFMQHTDVLDAGRAVQQSVNDLLKAESHLFSTHNLSDIVLTTTENLQIHVDCMNALGQLVQIDDVDDMGGQCWVYIRVSVHNILVPHGLVDVAVGDTFLFTPYLKPEMNSFTIAASQFSDCYCATHAIPYYRSCLGIDEEHSGHQLLAATRNSHTISGIGLGRALDSAAGAIDVIVLTDHVACPVINAELRLFTSGFVIERMEKLFLPAIVAFAPHISHVCSVDMATCYALAAKQRIPGIEHLSPAMKFDGMLMIFTIKAQVIDSPRSPRSPRTKSMEQCMQYNPFDALLLNTQNTQHVSFFLPADTRSMEAVQAMRSTWRAAFRMHDIVETLGDTPEHPVPMSIVSSFLVVTDSLNMHANEGVSALPDVCPAQVPGAGYGTMRRFYALSEWQRVSSKQQYSHDQAEEKSPLEPIYHKTLLIFGHAGSGALAVTEHLKQQMASSHTVHTVTITFGGHNFFDQVEAVCNNLRQQKLSPDTLIIVTALMLPTPYYPLSTVVDCLRSLFIVVYSVTVLCTSSGSNNKRNMGLSGELWKALLHDVALASNSADLTIIVESEGSQRNENLERVLDRSSVMRCSPHNIWLDVDIIEGIRDAMLVEPAFTQTPLHPSPRISNALPELFPRIMSQALAPAEGSVWDLEYLLMFFNIAFPQAVVASTVVVKSWPVPKNSNNKRGMLRGIDLAKAKTYFQKQATEGKKLYGKILGGSISCFDDIKHGMLSVHGVIEVSGCSTRRISVEACCDFVLIRPSSASPSKLMITTDMPSEIGERTKTIISACIPHALKPRPLMHISQLAEKDFKDIQGKYKYVELPAGWWYDGYSYVDLHGNKSSLRPDIDILCEMYVRDTNEKISKYNALMDECKLLCD